jgi:hypothetical protein
MKPWETESEHGDVAERLAEDTLYETLASRPRRRILAYLLEESESTLEELVQILAGWRASESSTMVTPAKHERIEIELYHQHLPYLHEHGFIEFDHESNTIDVQELADDIHGLIRRSIEAEAQLDR